MSAKESEARQCEKQHKVMSHYPWPLSHDKLQRHKHWLNW